MLNGWRGVELEDDEDMKMCKKDIPDSYGCNRGGGWFED